MPIQRCNINGKPGWRWGKKGNCYLYDPTSKSAETKARKKAESQGMAIGEFYTEMINRIASIKHSACGPNCDHKTFAKYPPVHENCTCKLVGDPGDRKWVLGTSESGPCKICIELSKKYNSNDTYSHD